MRLQVEVHVPANGAIVTGIVCDVDSGQNMLFVRERNGRWKAVAAGARNSAVLYPEGDEAPLPIQIEGDLNRAHDMAARRAKVVRSYTTVSSPTSVIDTYA